MSERKRVWRCCQSYPCICGMNTDNTLDEPKPESEDPFAMGRYEFCLILDNGQEVSAPCYRRASETTDFRSPVKVVFPSSQTTWGTVRQIAAVRPGDPITKAVHLFNTTTLTVTYGIAVIATLSVTPC